MKLSPKVSISRRKNRKAHYTAGPAERARRMSSRLSKEQRELHGIKTMPINVGDAVKVMSGVFKGKEGSVTEIIPEKYVVYVDVCENVMVNGQKKPVGIDASNLMIVKLNMNPERNNFFKLRNEMKAKINKD
ncbi:60S ribosomal protein L26-2 [Astathelohania contejeani]|uniref:60S ribosomal protein L26-2 n=1 Tax=Astathelohania contejeani TaxID=164912 RepID=A0ABQ7I2I4_9MICR|nr:60S ribosomal protein L26-2 [Thelohania contejeani]